MILSFSITFQIANCLRLMGGSCSGKLQFGIYPIKHSSIAVIKTHANNFYLSTGRRLQTRKATTCGRLVKMAALTTVVFDFDRTLIDDDSDSWVIAEMGLTPLFNQLRDSLPWNSLMDRMMEELHSQGKTVEDVKECLKRMPLHPRIIAAVKSANALRCDLKIVSDSNKFYIETILENHGLSGCFSEIYTNPTVIDKHGRLQIFPYHKSSLTSHGCNLCPPNLCKGLVLEGIRASSTENGIRRRFIYLGDGRNDFCPTLKLGNGDHVMPRKDYSLWKKIRSNPTLIKAGVHEWSNAEEMEKILLHLCDSENNRI